MNTFNCIKPSCGNSYQTKEEEAYYCPDCLKIKEAIAKQVDAQIAARPKKQSKSNWQQYEEQEQKMGRMPSGVVVKL